MTRNELRKAIEAACHAIEMPTIVSDYGDDEYKKPSSLWRGAKAFASGSGAKKEHVEKIQNMTLVELFDMAWEM